MYLNNNNNQCNVLLLLQNSSTSWYTENPELTDCFQKTVLIWTPCIYLWGFGLLDAYYIFDSKERNIPWNPLNITKLIITCLLIVLTLVDLGVTVHMSSQGEPVFNSDYYAPVIKILTFVSTTFIKSLFFCFGCFCMLVCVLSHLENSVITSWTGFNFLDLDVYVMFSNILYTMWKS